MHNQMVLKLSGYEMTESERLDAVFMALADPTRRAILARLARGEVSVTELAEPFEMSQPAISKHLKVLERAGLVTRSREATRRPVKIEALPLAEASEFLEKYREFWEGRYRRLDSLLADLQPEKNPNFKPDKQ
jgi:DNA-binding transcriptional ArsR family regulator